MLGRTAWIGAARRGADADDLTIDVDRTLRAQRHRASRSAAAAPARASAPEAMKEHHP
jgi:hypothetical protein